MGNINVSIISRNDDDIVIRSFNSLDEFLSEINKSKKDDTFDEKLKKIIKELESHNPICCA